MPKPASAAAAAQVGRIDQPGSGRVQLRHKGVEIAAGVGRLGGPCGRREIGRDRVARHVGAARAVHGDAVAAYQCRCRPGRSNRPARIRSRPASSQRRRHAAGVGRLGGPCGRREIGRERVARHVGAARAVHGDAVAEFNVAAAQVGRIDQPGSGRVQLRHKGVGSRRRGSSGPPRRSSGNWSSP